MKTLLALLLISPQACAYLEYTPFVIEASAKQDVIAVNNTVLSVGVKKTLGHNVKALVSLRQSKTFTQTLQFNFDKVELLIDIRF
tara:strand:+ start:275 stop:529 length:255 start_codon:yes stop_codon:yes gene_type:complete